MNRSKVTIIRNPVGNRNAADVIIAPNVTLPLLPRNLL